MQLKKTFLKLLVVGLCLFTANTVVKATEKENNRAKKSSSKIGIVERKTGISAHQNRTLAALYQEAVEWLRTPYRRGGMSHKGMDCSGLTGTIYKNVFGIKLQRSSKDISRSDVKDLKKNELEPGDLVFFSTSRRSRGVNHVGVYLGNNHFVHASCSKGVIISNLDEGYYKRTWVKGGRVKSDSRLLSKLFTGQEDFEPEIEKIVTEPFFINNIEPAHSIDTEEIIIP